MRRKKSGSGPPAVAVPHRWVDDPATFAGVVARLGEAERYALDTEFHRERTYYPHLALLQLSWDDETVLVDPLAVDLAPLAEVLDGPGIAVMHAGLQDLEVLDRACGTAPRELLDTQILAGFVGYSTPSLAALVDGELGRRVPKGDRLTDWLRRPLDDAQRAYAASDVVHLLELTDRLESQLTAAGRWEWAVEECRLFRDRPRGPADPEVAWTRIKEARHLRGRARGIAKEVAAWRELTAAETDQPVRFVLPDLAVVGVAQAAPTDLAALRKIRGLDGRHLKDGAGDQILAAVARGAAADPSETEPSTPPPRSGVEKSLRPAVALASAWVAQLARDERLDQALLATRGDLEAFLRGDDSRLAHGWRREILGADVRDLVEGRAALAFDGDGGLVLEPRSSGE